MGTDTIVDVAGAHLETAVKRFQLSEVLSGSTGAQAATVAEMQVCTNISQMMRHHASSDTTDWKPVTASTHQHMLRG